MGMATGMTNSIPNFWEREWQIPFPTFGNGNETLLFPGMIGNGNGNSLKKLGQILYFVVKIRGIFYIRFLVKLTITKGKHLCWKINVIFQEIFSSFFFGFVEKSWCPNVKTFWIRIWKFERFHLFFAWFHHMTTFTFICFLHWHWYDGLIWDAVIYWLLATGNLGTLIGC